MRFEGTSRDLGCTLILRGGDEEVLRRVKAILDLMVFVGYNLRLEEHLMRDEGAMLVATPPSPGKTKRTEWTKAGNDLPKRRRLLENLEQDARYDVSYQDDASLNSDALRFSGDIADSLRPYEETLLSASACVRLPSPYPLAKMKEEDERLHRLKEQKEMEETARILADERCSNERKEKETEKKEEYEKQPQGDSIGSPEEGSVTPTAVDPNESADVNGAQTPTEGDPISTANETNNATESATFSEKGPAPSMPASVIATTSHLIHNQDLNSLLRKPEDVAREAEYSLAKARHAAQLKSWHAYLSRSSDAVTPFAHQRLVMLVSTICAVTLRPCVGPTLQNVDYYGFGDQTLGQYLEATCHNATKPCTTKGCERAGVLHFTAYVHDQRRVQVVLERFVCPIPGEENRLLMWSYCKVCEVATPVGPVSEESWAYSFAKYLELHFYPAENCKTTICVSECAPRGSQRKLTERVLAPLAARFPSRPRALFRIQESSDSVPLGRNRCSRGDASLDTTVHPAGCPSTAKE